MFHEVANFLNNELLTIAGYSFTVAHFLLIPLVIVVGILLIQWSARTASQLMTKREVSPDVVQIVRRAITIIGLIVLVITILDMLNVPLTAFAFISGAIAIGVGFGAQNIINNFISGWILIWERPIRIDDFIEVGTTMGTVEEINTRSTRIRRVDGVHLLVPNSRLLEETVVNWTLVDNLLRSIVRVGVAYGADVQLVEELLMQVAEDHSDILEQPLPQVIFEDFGDSSLVFDLYFWVESAGDKSGRMIRSEVRFEIDRVFRQHGVVIAFPQRDVHLDGVVTLQKQDGPSS